jgi:hypothetical protein
MADHVTPHFDEAGLCCCPCEECTTRTAKFCVCEACSCESQQDHQPGGDGGSVEWITVPFAIRKDRAP